MSTLSNFFCLSAHNRWADVGDREKLAIPLKLMAPFLRSFHNERSGPFFYLTTCHRVEIYGVGVEPILVQNAWCEATGAQPAALKILRDLAALEHFARVGAGLESEILGENQIMGQLRSGMKENKDEHLLAPPLNHILQRGLRVARNVRSESRISAGRENLSSLALSRLSDVFESLDDKKFLIVGAGNMALLALEKLRDIGAQQITWINRSREKIEAHPYARFCRLGDFAKLSELASDSEVIFLATSAPHPILSKNPRLLAKKSQLRVVLDLGLPRNADSDLADLGFILRNVDDFKSVLDEQDALQRECVDFAEKILKRDLLSVYDELKLQQLGPIKQEFIAKWKWLGDAIFDEKQLEKSREILYNQQRLWAKLGHVLVTKSNELGPLEGGQFLRQLCESFEALEEDGDKVVINKVGDRNKKREHEFGREAKRDAGTDAHSDDLSSKLLDPNILQWNKALD